MPPLKPEIVREGAIVSQLATRGHVRCHRDVNVKESDTSKLQSQLATRGHVRCHISPQLPTQLQHNISIGNERTCALPLGSGMEISETVSSQLATRGHVRCHA